MSPPTTTETSPWLASSQLKMHLLKKHNIQAHSTDSKYIIHIPQTKNTQTKTTKTQNNRKHITDAFQMMHMPLWCLTYIGIFSAWVWFYIWDLSLPVLPSPSITGQTVTLFPFQSIANVIGNWLMTLVMIIGAQLEICYQDERIARRWDRWKLWTVKPLSVTPTLSILEQDHLWTLSNIGILLSHSLVSNFHLKSLELVA